MCCFCFEFIYSLPNEQFVLSYADYFFKTRVFKQKRLSANNTCRVRVYGDNASKFGSRLDKVNHGSTLNLKFTNWGNTPILKLNVVKFFLNAKRRYILM